MSGLSGYGTNQVLTHAIGRRVWAIGRYASLFADSGDLIKGARKCNVESFSRTRDGMEYGHVSVSDRSEIRSDGMFIPYYNGRDYFRATCRFESARDVRDAGFDEV